MHSLCGAWCMFCVIVGRFCVFFVFVLYSFCHVSVVGYVVIVFAFVVVVLVVLWLQLLIVVMVWLLLRLLFCGCC